MEKGIITVVGIDKVGIMAKVCNYLAEKHMNILDISQTIVDGYFNMIMMCDVSHLENDFNKVVDELADLGEQVGVVIRLQHDDIFKKMHRL